MKMFRSVSDGLIRAVKTHSRFAGIAFLSGFALAGLPAVGAAVELTQDTEVTTLAGYPDGVTCSLSTPITLTVTLSADETYSHPISGNIKLVKKGLRDLTIDRANTFTGGTEIYKGRLIAAHPMALGKGEIYVESDCSQTFTYVNQANLSALTIACASFTNDLRVSDWSSALPYYEGYRLANYNLQMALQNGRVSYFGNVRGGSLSVFCGVDRAINTASFKSTSFGDFRGTVTCTGTVYHLSASCVNYFKAVTCALLTGSDNFWCRYVNLSLEPGENKIAEARLGADHFICNRKDCLRGARIGGSSLIDGGHKEFPGIQMDSFSQQIDRFFKWQSIESRKDSYPHVVTCSEGCNVSLTMRATGDSECDWNFENDLAICWWPTNSAYRMTCISDRTSSTKGTITVSNGVFEVTGTYTFPNVTAVAVSEGASFLNNSSASDALKSVRTVTVDKGGLFKLGRADAMTTADVTFVLDTEATVEIPDDCDFSANAIRLAGNGLPIGTYTGKDSTTPGATPIPQLKGAGKVTVLTAPQTTVFDLNGVDRKVTSLHDFPFGFTNSSPTRARLTVEILQDITYDKPIGGNVTLVKKGGYDLTLAATNTYSGGTEIYCGRLVVADAAAVGPGEVYVESDCSRTFTNEEKYRDNLSALAIDCEGFTNDVRVSEWSGATPYYWSMRYANYNLQLMRAMTFSAKVTGGSLSVVPSAKRVIAEAREGAYLIVTLAGTIDLTGTLFNSTAVTINYTSPLLRCALMAATPNFWTHLVNLSAKEVHVGKYFTALDTLELWGGADLFRGETVIGGSGQYDSNQDRGNLNLARQNQLIDRFVASDSFAEVREKKTWPHRVYANTLDPVTLTMRGTGDSSCDWLFEQAISLCWWPTNAAYRMTCTHNRISTTTGSIIVSNGVFEVAGTYTFSNVTAVAVCEGATFENNSNAAGALRSVRSVRVDKGGRFKMGRVDAMLTGSVTFNLADDAVLEIPDGCELDVNAICFAGDGLPIGAYTGKDSTTPGATPIPQLKGSGKVYVLSSPKASVIDATWNGGAGDGAFETADNWNNAAVAGRFGDGVINATFASAGSEAVVAGGEVLNKMTFNGGVPTFTIRKGSDAASIALGIGGLTATASAATVVTNEVAVKIAGSQDWSIGQNVRLCMKGGLRQETAKSTLLNITGGVNDNRQLQLVGTGDAGTYAGRVDIKGNVAAVGDDPFGRAVEGVDGTVTLYGGDAGMLQLGQPGGPVTTITKPVVLSGYVKNSYLKMAYSNSGTTEAVKNRVSFMGPVDFGAGSLFNLNGFNPHVVFAGGGKMLSDVSNYSGSLTVTNKPMELSFLNTHAGTLRICLNVASNRMDGLRVENLTNGYANDLYFGADWALYEGNTEVYVNFHWGNGRYYASTIQLNGYNQRIGNLSSRLTTPPGATYSPFDLKMEVEKTQITSTGPATLYVNQTTDKAMIIPFTGKAALCKDGAAKLMVSNIACTAASPLTVRKGTLELFDASWKNASAVTVTALDGDATLKLSTTLAAANVPANKFFTRRAFDVTMTDGAGKARLDLAAGVVETAHSLVLNGKTMDGGCTYGSSASQATVKDDIHFTGAGMLRVTHPSGCILILR